VNPFLRYGLLAFESTVYGPAYGFLNQLVRVPEPLNPEMCWDLITRPRARPLEWLRKNYPPAFARKLLLRRILKQDHAKGIHNHYDVSNEFYQLMLDKRFMFYSCADFLDDADTLEIAQARKAKHILSMLEPQAGEELLELGPGWGSMLREVYAITGDKQNLHGFTLSPAQLEHNKSHGDFNVELRNFITTEYGKETYDKIYSVAVWEHVRPREIGPLLDKLHRALRPGGRLVKHFFCLNTDRTPISCLAGQLCFPGSQLSSHHVHLRAFEKAGFRIHQQTVHDYRPTIRAWFDNLTSNSDRAIAAAGLWEYNRFMVFLAATWKFFDDGEANVFRFQMEKPASKKRPQLAEVNNTQTQLVSLPIA
jgi:cyclopropane-fatty-acyl-phospholipid synthase